MTDAARIAQARSQTNQLALARLKVAIGKLHNAESLLEQGAGPHSPAVQRELTNALGQLKSPDLRALR